MPIFEITRETDNGEITTQRVEAPSWVEAWQAGKQRSDEDDTARISVRTLGQAIEVDIQTAGVRFRLRSIDGAAESRDGMSLEDTALDGQLDLATLRATTRRIEPVEIPPTAVDLPDIEHGSRAITRDYESPSPRHTITTARARPPRRRLDSTQDHEAVPAADLEKAASREPIGQPSVRVGMTGPRPVPPAGRARSQLGDPRELPQLFTPMAEFGAMASGASGRDRTALVQWAIETIWQQVPARMVLALQIIGREITITHARGDAERTLRGSHASLDQWPPALDFRGPSRMRFGPDPLVIWLRGVDNMRYPLEITSAMWTPVSLQNTRRTDSAKTQNATVILVIDAQRSTGFTEGEFSALCYLNQVLATRLS